VYAHAAYLTEEYVDVRISQFKSNYKLCYSIAYIDNEEIEI